MLRSAAARLVWPALRVPTVACVRPLPCAVVSARCGGVVAAGDPPFRRRHVGSSPSPSLPPRPRAPYEEDPVDAHASPLRAIMAYADPDGLPPDSDVAPTAGAVAEWLPRAAARAAGSLGVRRRAYTPPSTSAASTPPAVEASDASGASGASPLPYHRRTPAQGVDVDGAVHVLDQLTALVDDGVVDVVHDDVVRAAVTSLVSTVAHNASSAVTPVRALQRLCCSPRVAGSGPALSAAWDAVVTRAVWSGRSHLVSDALGTLGRCALLVGPAGAEAVADAVEAAAYIQRCNSAQMPFDLSTPPVRPQRLPLSSLCVAPRRATASAFESRPDFTPVQWQAVLCAVLSLSREPEGFQETLSMLRAAGAAGLVRRAFTLFDSAFGEVGDDGGESSSANSPDPSLLGGAFESLLDACRVAGHPNRSVKLFRLMARRGVRPSLRAYHLLLSTLELADHPSEAAAAIQACVAADLNPPAQMFAAAMSALARAEDVSGVLRVLRLAQASGVYTTVDSHLSSGYLNVSGMPAPVITVLLHALLTELRDGVDDGSTPPHLTVFATSRTRSHTKAVLDGMGLPSTRRNWCMTVDDAALAAFLRKPEASVV